MPSIVELLVKEFDAEMVGTRKTLELVPEGKESYKPHEKSMEFGKLTALVAGMPGWLVSVIQEPSLDLAAGPPPAAFKSTKELVAAFDKAKEAGRKALQGTNDNHLLTTNWKLMMKDKVLQDTLRYDAVRISVINHLCHHRAQIGIYTRLSGGKIPGLYGPSADEPWGSQG
jgi:uncharacterized damage-inducible protein DinB